MTQVELVREISSSNMSADARTILIGMAMSLPSSTPTIEGLDQPQKKKRNNSGIYQIDPYTLATIGTFTTIKEALSALGRNSGPGIGDARTRTQAHFAYGYLWFHRDEWDNLSIFEKEKYRKAE